MFKFSLLLSVLVWDVAVLAKLSFNYPDATQEAEASGMEDAFAEAAQGIESALGDLSKGAIDGSNIKFDDGVLALVDKQRALKEGAINATSMCDACHTMLIALRKVLVKQKPLDEAKVYTAIDKVCVVDHFRDFRDSAHAMVRACNKYVDTYGEGLEESILDNKSNHEICDLTTCDNLLWTGVHDPILVKDESKVDKSKNRSKRKSKAKKSEKKKAAAKEKISKEEEKASKHTEAEEKASKDKTEKTSKHTEEKASKHKKEKTSQHTKDNAAKSTEEKASKHTEKKASARKKEKTEGNTPKHTKEKTSKHKKEKTEEKTATHKKEKAPKHVEEKTKQEQESSSSTSATSSSPNGLQQAITKVRNTLKHDAQNKASSLEEVTSILAENLDVVQLAELGEFTADEIKEALTTVTPIVFRKRLWKELTPVSGKKEL